MNIKKKHILTVITIFLIGLIIVGGSYAYFTWNSNISKNVLFNAASNFKKYIVYDEGESKFVGDFQVSNNYYTGMHSTITLSKKSEASSVELLAIIHMNINSIGSNMAKSSALKWTVTRGDSTSREVLASGNFIDSKAGDTLTLVSNIEVTTTPTKYTIWIWLDGSENPSDLLSGETLDTNVWTEINQTEGIEDRFEITRINANYQDISATVVDNKYKVTNYAVTTSNTTPSTWVNITQANQNNIYNLTYTATETGTYYVWFKDSNNRTTSRSIQVSTVDNTAPSCTWGNWSVTQIANNQTATISLTCTDEQSIISIGNLTTESITKSNNNITLTNITKSSITNGYTYTITVKGTETDGTSTLTLPVDTIKNSVNLGNSAVTSSSITVDNKIDISSGTLTLSQEDITYDGTAKEPSTTVVVNNITLIKDTDYTVTYSNNTNSGVASVVVTGINNYKGTLDTTFNINYVATIYYNDNNTVGDTTIKTKLLQCHITSGNNCTVTITDDILNSVGTYNNSYAGLASNINTMTQAIANNVTTLTLNRNITYYTLYRSNVTIYRPNSTSTCTTNNYYRNQWFTSTSAMSNTVLSSSTTGTSNSTPSAVSYYPLTMYTSDFSMGGNSYPIAEGAYNNHLTLYAVGAKNITVTFYYYNGTGQTSVNNTGQQYLSCTAASTSGLINGIVSVPDAVTNSTGPNGSDYKGLSTAVSSTTTTTTITTAVTKYYSIYGNDYTATFVKENNNVDTIGSSTLSCSSSYTSNGSVYNGSNCEITLPTITAAFGYAVLGWYNGNDELLGLPADTLVLTSDITLTAKADKLTAEKIRYDDIFNTGCTDTQCMLDFLDTTFTPEETFNGIHAKNLRYDNSNTKVTCSTVQCMLDYLDS